MRSPLLIILLLLSTALFAQKVRVEGVATAYKNRDIGAFVHQDYISNLEKEISNSTVDSIGNFLLEFNLSSVRYVTFRIGNSTCSMYAEPGAKYEVQIEAPDSTTYANPNIDHDVKMSIKLDRKTGMNALTMDYDKRFDDFLGVEYKSFVRRNPHAKIDSFRVAMREFYSTVKNDYFNNYIDYSVATLLEETKYSRSKLFNSYLAKRPILYDHPEYMNFFNAYYRQNLQKFALSKEGKAIAFQINDRGSFSGAMGVMKRQDFGQNDTLAELVLLKGLYESYYDQSFKRSSIAGMLKQIAEESMVEKHRQIAVNMLNSFSKLQKGTAAPFFELPDRNGLTHSIDELKAPNKYMYIMFFSEDCSSCLQQMKVIPALKKTYGERITFVSISSTPGNAALKNFQAKNPKYDWLFLYDNTGGKLMKEYEILSMPAYFVLDEKGKFVQVPAESPEGEIEQLFHDLTKIRGKLHNIGNRQNN
jgi:thiol-disulfide isomerase/thioredoxin